MVTQTKQETRDSKPQENIKKFKEVLLYVLESIGANLENRLFEPYWSL